MRFIRFAYIIPVLTVVFALCSCNSDVFVPDTRPSVDHVTLNGDGDSTVIAYNPEGLVNLKLNHMFSFKAQVYDKGGNLVSGETVPSEIGRVVLRSNDIDMEFISTPAGIKIKVNESLYVGDVDMFLDFDYGYTYYSVQITVNQCSRYDVIDVVYDMEAADVFGPWAEDASSTFVVRNDSDSEIRMPQYPFENEWATYRFEMKASVNILTTMDEKRPEIQLPTFVNGEAGLHGRSVTFIVGNTISIEPTVGWYDVARTLVVQPHTYRRYYRYVEHMRLDVPVRVVIRNPVNGNVRNLTGELTVIEPTGFFYGYQNLPENE